jgi:hypothetical protein
MWAGDVPFKGLPAQGNGRQQVIRAAADGGLQGSGNLGSPEWGRKQDWSPPPSDALLGTVPGLCELLWT